MTDQVPTPRIPHPSTQDNKQPLVIVDMTPSGLQVAAVLAAGTAAAMVLMAWCAVLALWVIEAAAATLP
ncbi:hypothetical protein [Streptomyces sp. NPDC088739]|uniref:hypothetical protein n=1 Tax=Streptomyces sp. NPDC088739 TaxID=3365882 RepID=UPI0037FDB75C